MMLPIPRRAQRPFLHWVRRSLFVVGIALLGFVGYSLLDAKLFQFYENWRLDRAVKASSVAAAPPKAAPAALSSPIEVPRTPAAPGEMLGRLEISRIGISVVIVEGISGRSLRRAVGHIPGTAFPGERGNVGIAGHRDTFFRPLREVRPDDEITLTTLHGTYRYRVDSARVVAEDDTAVLGDSKEPLLTLVTCYPFYYVGPSPDRFVVRAHQN